MTDLDLAIRLTEIMRETARTEILPRYLQSDLSIKTKAHAGDLSTDADLAAERRIVDQLRAEFPSACIVGEEADWVDRQQHTSLLEADLAFTIDPLDGTANFVAGLPLFAVIVAAARGGRTHAAAILDPFSDDVMYAAEGFGAWRQTRTSAAQRISVRQRRSFQQAQAAGISLSLPAHARARILSKIGEQPSPTILHCSGHEYRLVASGHRDFLLHVSKHLKPWDHAAGLLLCREAGGYAASLDGEEWTGLHPQRSILCASSQQLWQDLRDWLELERVAECE
ncbi:MAG: inositol monophosphatase [Hyphomonadaceae bacterium]